MTMMARSFRVAMMLTLSVACAALAVFWPSWLTALRAQTGYPPVISILQGNDQSGSAGAALPLVVLVTRNSEPSSGDAITWTVSASGGTLSNGSSTASGSNGQSSNTLTLGTVSTSVSVVVSVAGGNSVTFNLRCTNCPVPTAPVISGVSGSGQSGTSGSTLAPFQALVTRTVGPVGGLTVTWAVSSNGGTLQSGPTTRTDAAGNTSNRLTLGTTATVTVTATVEGGGSTTFTATCINNCVVVPPPPTLTEEVAKKTAEQGLEQAGTTLAPSAMIAAQTQATNIGLRLLNLRRGGPTISASGLALNVDGQSVPMGAAAAGLFSLFERGGGASADPTGLGGLGIGLFVNGIGSFGDQRASSREPGVDFHTLGLTAGADYRVIPQLVLGAAFGYASIKSDVNGGLGETDTNSYSISAYASVFLGAAFHLDTIFTYGWNDYDTRRNINEPGFAPATAKASPSGDQFAVSANAGYDFHFGGLTVGPSLRVSYVNVDVDSYREHGSGLFDLSVKSQNLESLTTSLGGEVSYAISVPFGVLTPLVRFEWEHEYKAGSRLVHGSLISNPAFGLFSARTDDPDRDYFNLGAGLTGTFRSGVSAFFYWETILGRSRVTNHLFTLGVRLDF